MLKKFLICVFCSLICVSCVYAQETLTITTYYPSPYGVYNQLQTNSLGVGDNDNDGGLDSGDVPTTAGDVWIKGNVGIGTTGPNAKLSLTTTGTELGGTAASVAVRTMAGSLGTTAGNTLKLASIGFTSGNQSSLGIEALRTAGGTDWTTTAIGLKMDVDATSPVNNAQIWLTSTGNVGIGTTSPQSKLQVNGGYTQLDDGNTAAPAAADCNAAAEEGRMYWDATNDNCYICSGVSGWRKIATVAP